MYLHSQLVRWNHHNLEKRQRRQDTYENILDGHSILNGRLRLATRFDIIKDALTSWLVKQLPRHIILFATIHLWAVVSTAENGMEITMSEAIAKWQEHSIR